MGITTEYGTHTHTHTTQSEKKMESKLFYTQIASNGHRHSAYRARVTHELEPTE